MLINSFSKIFLIGTLLGSLTSNIFSIFGIYTGDKAIQYYAEVHQSRWNSVIHTIGMPFTYYGLLLCVPPLLGMNIENTLSLQLFFYFYFISYYLTLDITVGIIVAICYLPSQINAMHFYHISPNRMCSILYGGTIAFIALSIQEIFGHWLGGDAPSRIEGIPNAIWHAGYYSIWHLIK